MKGLEFKIAKLQKNMFTDELILTVANDCNNQDLEIELFICFAYNFEMNE